MIRRRWIVALGAFLVVLAACGSDGDDAARPAGDESPTGQLTVFAASSLTDAFTELGAAFETANPGTTVEFNFASSSSLVTSITEGAPADVFASANESNMTKIVDAGEAGREPQVFVTNRLQIAVPSGNPAGITGLDDFARAELLIGLCAEEVPCGEFGREVLDNAGVTASVDTKEPDVRALLTRVEAGELDAGIVYVTDVASAEDTVEGIDIPDASNVTATYPIVRLKGSSNPDAADAFVDFVLSEEGQATLAKWGFLEP